MKVPKSVRRIAAGVFVVLALAFFAYTLADAWNETHGRLPSVARLAVAALLVAVGLIAAAVAWVTLLGSDRRLDHGAALLVSQLGKYVPGAIWQAAGLVSLSRSLGVRVGRSVTAFTVMALTQAVAGCTFALLLAFTWSSVSIVPRILLGVGGVAAVTLLDRRWMVKLLHVVPRTRSASLDVVPTQGAIVAACVASIVTLAATSATYVLLLGQLRCCSPPAARLRRVRGRLDGRLPRGSDSIGRRNTRGRAGRNPARSVPGGGDRGGERVPAAGLGGDGGALGRDRVASGSAGAARRGARRGHGRRRRRHRRGSIVASSSALSARTRNSVAYSLR